jgi:hypothetical protein
VAPEFIFECVVGGCPGNIDQATGFATPDCILADGGWGTCCHDACVDPGARGTFTTVSDCGGCAIACPSGDYCYGNCNAPSGIIYCDDSAPCDAGQICSDAVCVSATCTGSGATCALPDGPGLCCNSVCVNILEDHGNCGGCGLACPPREACYSGSCVHPNDCSTVVASAGGLLPCALDGGAGGTCCGNACVDLLGDSSNCTFCGVSCVPGTTCERGACVGTGSCEDGGCPDGEICEGFGWCAPASGSCATAEDGEVCDIPGLGPAGLCCGGVCVQYNDPSNCGFCGNSCSSGACLDSQQGVCFPDTACTVCQVSGGCPGGDLCLGGVCTPTPTACGVNSFGQLCPADAGIGICCGEPATCSTPAECGF